MQNGEKNSCVEKTQEKKKNDGIRQKPDLKEVEHKTDWDGLRIEDKGQVKSLWRYILEKDDGFGSMRKDICNWKSEVCQMTFRPENI